MKRQKEKRACFFLLSILLVVFMAVQTAAYSWTQIEQVSNEFQTGLYSTSLEETFISPYDWSPGQYTNKDVTVQNDGTVPVFVKVEISQEWIRRENVYDLDGSIIEPAAGDSFTLTFQTADGEEYAAIIDWGEDVVVLSSGVSDGLSLGLPTVDSIEEATGKWLLMDETTDGNLVFYYIGVLDSAAETPLLLDGVEMNPQIQSAILEVHTTWDQEDGEWVSTTVRNSTNDYENATYTLGVTAYTVQATHSAVLELFDSDVVSEQAVISYLQTLAITGTDIADSRDATSEKMLYLRAVDGELCYIPVSSDGNWFMSYWNMIPGESYADSMVVSNQTDTDYNLYMQAISRDDQEKIAEELLDYITLAIYYDGVLLYEGTARGADYEQLYNVIYLGRYEALEENLLEVVATLDKDTPIDYANTLAIIDWQFMVEEIDGTATTVALVDTGDDGSFVRYLCLMIVAGIALIFCVRKIKAMK